MNKPKSPVLGYVLKGYPRISETFISNEILLLEKLGFKIHIFSMRQPREDFCHDSVKEIKAKVDYLPDSILGYLPQLFYHNLLLAFKKPLPYLKSITVAFRRFLRTRKSATIKHLLQAGYIVHHLLPDKSIAHIHAHFAHSPASVAMFTNQLCGIPFSFTAHAKDIYTSNKIQLSEKMSLASFIVTCTEYNRRYLQKLSREKKDQIHRIYHGIDLQLFSCDSSHKKYSPPYKILTIARLTPKKGLITVLKALRILTDMGFLINHTLIGDGDDRDEIVSFIEKNKMDKICRWIGSQPHNVVLEQYRDADLFILGCEIAENGDRDGIPNVFLESMAMGVPIVATEVSAIPEAIENEKTGLLVPPGRPEEAAKAMARLLSEAELRNRIIIQARNVVTREFDNKALIYDLAALFEEAGLQNHHQM
jgi:glycosyltransferase involved in cell wall biosynthesis